MSWRSVAIVGLVVLSCGATVARVYLYDEVPRGTKATCPTCEDCSEYRTKYLDLVRFGTIPLNLPKVDDTGLATAQVGGYYRTAGEAEKEMELLKGYLKECEGIGTSWFCSPNLVNRVEIKKGRYSYFLVITQLTNPQLYALCNFMWSTSALQVRWARQPNHTCREFDERHLNP